MQFSIFLTIAALGSVSLAQTAETTFKLVSRSSNPILNNKALSAKHEGAGFSYVVIEDSATAGSDFRIDTDKKVLYSSLDGGSELNSPVGVDNGFVTVSDVFAAGESTLIQDFDRYILSFQGTIMGFYGCKDIDDPYNYSKDNYLLIFSADGEPTKGDCIAISVQQPSEYH